MDREFSTVELDAIINAGLKAISEEGNVTSSEDWIQLQQAATIFLDKLQNLITTSKQIISMLNKIKTVNDSQVETVLQQVRMTKLKTIQGKYQLAFAFDEMLTRYRGQAPKKAIFVYTGKNNIPQSIEMDMSELINYIDKSGRIYQNIGALFANEREELEKSKKEELNEAHIQQARSAYIGVANRLARYHEVASKSNKQKQGGLLMWKDAKSWTLARVTNMGDVKEAYVAALMAKHQTDLDKLCGIDTGSPEYYSHVLISTFFNEYIANVTNRPAIIEEDVITNDFQYAIKGNKATMPGLRQYIKTALEIKSSSNLLTKDQIEEFLSQKIDRNNHRNKILTTTDQITDEEIEKIMQEFNIEVFKTI